MNADILVSIVVPAYNAENYIEKCVSSILKQDYMNLQVIIVDDGSSDSTPILVDNLASSDRRIEVIHTDNRGVSSARNTGYLAAKGDWLWFIDADDYVREDAVSVLLNDGCISKADCIVFDAIQFNEQGKIRRHTIDPSSFPENGTHSSKDLLHSFIKGQIGNFIWSFFLKKEVLQMMEVEGQIFATGVKLFEDILFSHRLVEVLHNIYVEKSSLYYYRQNSTSAVHNPNFDVALSGYNAISFLRNLPVPDNLIHYRDEYYCRNCFVVYTLAGSCCGAKNLKSNIRKDITEYIRNGSFFHFSFLNIVKCLMIFIHFYDFAKFVLTRFHAFLHL